VPLDDEVAVRLLDAVPVCEALPVPEGVMVTLAVEVPVAVWLEEPVELDVAVCDDDAVPVCERVAELLPVPVWLAVDEAVSELVAVQDGVMLAGKWHHESASTSRMLDMFESLTFLMRNRSACGPAWVSPVDLTVVIQGDVLYAPTVATDRLWSTVSLKVARSSL